MASQKEFTLFVADSGAPLAFWYDHCAALLLKNRKSDRVGLLTPTSTHYQDAPFTYESFKQYSRHLEGLGENGDLLHTVAAAVAVFKDKIHLKFLRHLIILTNGNTTPDFGQDLQEVTKLVNDHNIKVVLIGSFDDSQKAGYLWTRLLSQWEGSRVIDAEDAKETATHSSALKKVAPRAAFTGRLRFGIDVEDDQLSEDKAAIAIEVSMFPAIRVEKASSSHEYVFDDASRTVHSLQRSTAHYIKKYSREGASDLVAEENDAENEDYEKEHITDYVPGFKYSKRDIIAVNKELAHVSQLPSTPGFDVLGFIKKQHLSLAYLIEESSYIIPPSNSTSINHVSFNALVRSLIDMDCVATARFVPKENADVQVCALFPQQFQVNSGKRYGFVSVRLAFKEDEKLGRFPSLTADYRQQANGDGEDEPEEDDEDEPEDADSTVKNEKKRVLPSSDAKSLMEEFVKARDLDEKQPGAESWSSVLDNQKLALVDTEFLNLPKSVKSDADTKLMPSCPATNKLQHYLKRILTTSVSKESLDEFLNEEKFVEKYLVQEGQTSLFNYSNILAGNTTDTGRWLTSLNRQSAPVAKKLATALDSRYLKQDPQAKKRKYSDATYEKFFKKDEKAKDSFDPYFDIQDILS